MIVRIAGEGQYEVPDSEHDALNALDDALLAITLKNDHDAFADAFKSLLDRVRSEGKLVASDALVASDILLPPADASMEEVHSMLEDDGLIPG